ncbi:hypothetical protein [Actinoallomurus sp. CA-150999]|uniref:hypothetical protein n=1 Tax=Actinoallomurus sp. CA-150999 TaxID=3239887 RepID=UPI003D90DE2B
MYEDLQGYCEHIADFVGSLSEHPDAVRGVAYLHNAADLDVWDLFELSTTERTRLFTKTRRGSFLDYLRAQFVPRPVGPVRLRSDGHHHQGPRRPPYVTGTRGEPVKGSVPW